MSANVDANGLIHASAVAFGSEGVLIVGPSGAGKSGLALDLVSRGALLVGDDRILLQRHDDGVIATAPVTLCGLIEARGIGILSVPEQTSAPIKWVVDLGQAMTDRLPLPKTITFLDVEIDLIPAGDVPNLAAAIHILATGGRRTT